MSKQSVFWLSFILLFPLCAHSSNELRRSWYHDSQRGWFWHESKEKEKPEKNEPQTKIEVTNSKTPEQDDLSSEDTTTLDVAWLRENLPKLQETAINNPTQENLAAAAYAQRLMLDLGSRFSSKMIEFIESEQYLDESSRRPNSALALSTFSIETQDALTEIMKKVQQKSHVWFFFSSSCQYCLRQIPVLRELKNRYGTNILAISMDGGLLPGLESFELVSDVAGTVARRFGVTVTPSMYLVDNEGKEFASLTTGLHTLPEIEERIMFVAREMGDITSQEFENAQSVREINVFRNDNGHIIADSEKLKSDPGYLADLLRKQLKNIVPYGSNPLPTSNAKTMEVSQ